MVARGSGKQSMESSAGTEFQFCKMKRVLEMDGGNSCKTLNYLMLLNWALRNGWYVPYILSQLKCFSKKDKMKRKGKNLPSLII